LHVVEDSFHLPFLDELFLGQSFICISLFSLEFFCKSERIEATYFFVKEHDKTLLEAKEGREPLHIGTHETLECLHFENAPDHLDGLGHILGHASILLVVQKLLKSKVNHVHVDLDELSVHVRYYFLTAFLFRRLVLVCFGTV
jgi:hypothetical protein